MIFKSFKKLSQSDFNWTNNEEEKNFQIKQINYKQNILF